jgi:arabinose-5-phosphate isomerase
MPRVAPGARMPDIIYEMSQKGLGMTTVVDESGRLAGIVTDGDLRRLMQTRGGETIALTAEQAMTRQPVTIGLRELASTALSRMEQRKITAVVVVDEGQRVCGVLHLHDLWTLELY